MNIHTMTLKKSVTNIEMKLLNEMLFNKKQNTRGDTYRQNNVVVSKLFSEFGININLKSYRDKNGYFHNIIFVRINPYNLCFAKSRIMTFTLTPENALAFVEKFNFLFSSFPNGFNDFNDYTVDRIDLCCDISMSQDIIDFYIRFGNGCSIPPHCRRELWYDKTGKRMNISAHRASIISPSFSAVLYDKKKQLEAQNIQDYDSEESTIF